MTHEIMHKKHREICVIYEMNGNKPALFGLHHLLRNYETIIPFKLCT